MKIEPPRIIMKLIPQKFQFSSVWWERKYTSKTSDSGILFYLYSLSVILMLNFYFLWLSREFGKQAVKLLDLSYSDSCLNTIASLDEKFPELNNKTTIKLAHIARNKFFIAHKSCQKWLVQRWHGNLLIREVDYGVFKLPNWLKVWMFKALLKATLKMQFKNIHLRIQ